MALCWFGSEIQCSYYSARSSKTMGDYRYRSGLVDLYLSILAKYSFQRKRLRLRNLKVGDCSPMYKTMCYAFLHVQSFLLSEIFCNFENNHEITWLLLFVIKRGYIKSYITCTLVSCSCVSVFTYKYLSTGLGSDNSTSVVSPDETGGLSSGIK